MRIPIRTPLPAAALRLAPVTRAAALQIPAVALAAALTLAACGSAVAPPATGSHPASPASGAHPASPASGAHPAAARSASAVPGPPAGSRSEAAALARLLLSRLRLPPAARRLPPDSLPPSLSQPATQYADGSASFDQRQLFALTQPMDAAAAFLAAHLPAGSSLGGTGEGSSPGGPTMREVTDTPRSLPEGVSLAELVLTVVPDASGGSLLRADAQIVWYPPRTAAEYIDPGRYHVLTITVMIAGPRTRTLHKVITSQALIARLAEVLDRSPAEPAEAINCPMEFAGYRLALSVSRSSRPAVVISTTQWPCGGTAITVNGHPQPALADNGSAAALVRQFVSVTPET